MKKSTIIMIFLGAVVSSFANAGCVGSGSFKSCNDSSGNSYTVSTIGNSTYVNGSNSQTGSQWSQSSNTVGNTTYTNGTSANGSSWNGTMQRNGSNTTYSGTDSNGNPYMKVCNQYSCN